MTIEKHLVLPFFFLLLVAIGLATYAGLQLGMDAAASDTPVTAQPVASADPSCEPAIDLAALQTALTPAVPATPQPVINDFATNSGEIRDSQFNDGGFGDIGQQWRDVNVAGDVTTINVSDGSTANVDIGDETIINEPAPGPTPVAEPSPSPVVEPTPPPVEPSPIPTPAPEPIPDPKVAEPLG